MNESREYDLVLWGATGFTGRLVAEYLADQYSRSNLNWAIAGRNEEKLNKLKSFLTDIDPGWESLPILIGDAFDRDSLDAITERTRVVCSTVGPYAVYGTDLVASCVEHGTDYCDLTGEVQWIRRMIEEFHEPAQTNGAKIVHSCGFDSVPSDIGTLMVQKQAVTNFGVPCSRVGSFVSTGSAEFSGGTVASMLNSIEDAAESPDAREALNDPYSLAPSGHREGPDGNIQQYPRYDSDLEMWTAPFLMAIANEKIVRRTNALLDYPYGQSFRYRESLPTGNGVAGFTKATGLSAGIAALTGLLAFSPTRSLLKRFVLPDPGEGPSPETIENGSFRVELIGIGTTEDGTHFRVTGNVKGSRDPGYGSTAWMLGESAVSLALDDTESPLGGGILTPASGIGMPLADRLEQAGMTFDVRHSRRT
jgi:short subunit dehydrogenase-like uncharacterized protein